MTPAAAAPLHDPATSSRPEPGAWRLARATLLGIAGVLQGLLLADGPVLERYVALRLGPEGLPIDITLLCCAVLGLLGVAAAFATWLQVAFYAALASSMSWVLAESSQHPFWIWSSKGIWRPDPASAGRLAGHAVTVTLAVAAAVLHALQDDAAAARAQAMERRQREHDLRRAGLAGGAIALGAGLVAFAAATLLDDATQALVGALDGPAAFLVLLGSGVLLAAGFILLALDARRRPA